MSNEPRTPTPRRFAVLGTPIEHSKSPTIHRAAYDALGLPHTYEKLHTTNDELPARIEALRAGAFDGFNITIPHKTNVLSLVDEIDPTAQATGAANTIVRTATGQLRAHNTDAPALVTELVRLAGDRDTFLGKSAIVLGTGGAARAAIFALGILRVECLVVRGRRASADLGSVFAAGRAASRVAPSTASAPVRLDRPEGAVPLPSPAHESQEGARGEDRSGTSSDRPDARGPSTALAFQTLVHIDSASPRVERSDVAAIIQATSAGMTGADDGAVVANAVHWSSIPKSCVALDVVYAPRRTSFLERAANDGLATAGGLGMLVRQAAFAFELWLGIRAPFEAMFSAVEDPGRGPHP